MVKFALDHRRYQGLNQRHAGTAEQRRGQQRRGLAHEPTCQARQQNHHQAQRNAAPFTQASFHSHTDQRHQAHAHYGQAGEQGAALETQAGGLANFAE